jgi:hypothetical protein
MRVPVKLAIAIFNGDHTELEVFDS